MKNFKKPDFVASMSEKTGMTKQKSEMMLELIVDLITETLASGDEVSIRSFGKWYLFDYPERAGYNIKTEEHITLPPIRVAKFKPFQPFRAAIKDAHK